MIENGVTSYRRRPGVQYVVGDRQQTILTNQNIVPYNPYLLKKFDCHINVEWCSSVNTMKYLFKYIFKGVDMARLLLMNRNGTNTRNNPNDEEHNVYNTLDNDRPNTNRPFQNPRLFVQRPRTFREIREQQQQQRQQQNPLAPDLPGVDQPMPEQPQQPQQQQPTTSAAGNEAQEQSGQQPREEEQSNEPAQPENRDNRARLNYDEIRYFVEGRFVSSFEAFFRIFGYNLIEFSHTIVRLAIHLPDQQRIVVPENATREQLEQAADAETMLTAYFRLNTDPEHGTHARTLLYTEIPRYYRFVNNRWQRRVQDLTDKTLSRIYSVSPRNIELFCQRILLLHRRGN
jgi:hypothetical protein